MFPKKVKFRKWQTARENPRKAKRHETRGTSISFGSFALKAETQGRVRANHLEAARKAVTRYTKKGGKLWIRVFPDRPYTAKPAEVGMGKGKGDPQGYEAIVRPGRILFELDGIPDIDAREALRKAGAKLPIKTRVVARVSS